MFNPYTEKYGPEKSPYSNTFHAWKYRKLLHEVLLHCQDCRHTVCYLKLSVQVPAMKYAVKYG